MEYYMEAGMYRVWSRVCLPAVIRKRWGKHSKPFLHSLLTARKLREARGNGGLKAHTILLIMETTIAHWGSIGITEKRMETIECRLTASQFVGLRASILGNPF